MSQKDPWGNESLCLQGRPDWGAVNTVQGHTLNQRRAPNTEKLLIIKHCLSCALNEPKALWEKQFAVM